jgi:hypothetical protein
MRKIIVMAWVLFLAFVVWAIPTRLVGDNSITSNKRTISTTFCKLFSIIGQTTNGTGAQYIHVYDHIAWATNGGTPKFAFMILTNQYFMLEFGTYGVDMDAVLVCNSPTAQTTTLGSTNCAFQAIITQ